MSAAWAELAATSEAAITKEKTRFISLSFGSEGKLDAQRHGLQILSAVHGGKRGCAGGGHRDAGRQRRGLQPAVLDQLVVQGEPDDAVGIPVEAEGSDALIPSPYGVV